MAVKLVYQFAVEEVEDASAYGTVIDDVVFLLDSLLGVLLLHHIYRESNAAHILAKLAHIYGLVIGMVKYQLV